MVEMELSKIVIDEKRHDQLIVLKEKGGGQRVLPIVIGLSEVLAIRSKISGGSSPRPLTHDLLFSVINGLEAQVQSIRIDKLQDNIFFATVVLLAKSGGTVEIDARPSDSIALAVRAKCPIYVEEEVIRQTESLEPEK